MKCVKLALALPSIQFHLRAFQLYFIEEWTRRSKYPGAKKSDPLCHILYFTIGQL